MIFMQFIIECGATFTNNSDIDVTVAQKQSSGAFNEDSQ